MSNGNIKLEKAARFLYNAYGGFLDNPDFELADSDIKNIQDMYGDNIEDFKNDFERTFVIPRGLNVDKDMFSDIVYTTKKEDEERGEVYDDLGKKKEQNIHDWIRDKEEKTLDIVDEETGKKKSVLLTEGEDRWDHLTAQKKSRQLNEKYDNFGLKFGGVDGNLIMTGIDGEHIKLSGKSQDEIIKLIDTQIKSIDPKKLEQFKIDSEKEKVERIKEYNDFVNENAPTPEELTEIEERFSDKSIFDRQKKTITDPSDPMMTTTIFSSPHSEYLTQAAHYFKKNKITGYSNEEYYDKALEFAKYGEIEKLRRNKWKVALNDIDTDFKKTAGILLGHKEKYSDQNANDLQQDYDALHISANQFDSSKEYISALQFNKNMEDPDFVFPEAKEGEKVLTINDKRIPASIYQEHLYNTYKTKMRGKAISEAQKSIGDRIENIANSSEAWDLLKRDYDDGKKFVDMMLTNTVTFLKTGGNWVAREGYKFTNTEKPWEIQRNAPDVINPGMSNVTRQRTWTDEERATYTKNRIEYLEYFNKNDENTKIEQNRRRGLYQEDIEFGAGEFSAFSWQNPANFAKFMLQEVATQAPIIAMASLGYAGTPLMFLTMAGDRRAEYEYEELMEGKEYSEAYKTLWSAAHAAIDVGTEALTTIPLLNRAKKLMSTGNYSKRGFYNNIKQFYKENTLMNAFVYSGIREAGGEGLATFMQNWVDERPLLENMGHTLFSGGMFGMFFGGIPYMSARYNALTGDHAKNANVRKTIDELDILKNELGSLSFQGKGKNSQDFKDISKSIKEKESELNEHIKKANNLQLESKAWKWFAEATEKQERIKNKAKKINASDRLESTKKRLLDAEKIKFDRLQAQRDMFKNPEAWGNKFALLESADKARYNKIHEQAKNDVGEKGTERQIGERAEHIFYLEEVALDVKNKRNIGKQLGLKLNTKLFKKGEESQAIKELKELQKNGEISLKELNETIKGINDGGLNGFEKKLDKSGTMINWVFHENAASNSKQKIGTHEVGHSIFYEAIGRNPDKFADMANQIKAYTQKMSPATWARISLHAAKIKDGKVYYPPAEIISEFLEEVGTGQFNFKENHNWFAGLFGHMINDTFSKIVNQEMDMDWKNSDHVVAYITGIGKKIADGTIQKQDIIQLKKRGSEITIEEGRKRRGKISKSETIRDIPSKDDFAKVRARVDKYVPKDKTWSDEIADDILNKVIKDGSLDPFIQAKRPYGYDPKEFLQEAHIELIGTFRRFDPKVNDSLFGWIMGEYGYRIGDIYVREKKRKRIKTVSAEQAGQIAAKDTATEEILEDTQEFAKSIGMNETVDKHIDKVLYDSLSLFSNKLTGDIKNLNKTKKEFIRHVLRNLSDKSSPAVQAVSKLLGTKQVLYDYLKKNKSKILNRVSKTYLMNNFPQVIQKSVGGKWKVDEDGKIVKRDVVRNGKLYKVKIFEPNFVPHNQWKGKKITEIDSIKMADTGISSNLKYSIVDNNAVKNMSDTEFLSHFFKDVNDVSTWMQNRKEGGAVAIVQEVGMEKLKDDVVIYNKLQEQLEIEKNPILRKKIKQKIGKTLMSRFKDTQAIKDLYVEAGFANEIVRQTDRGGISRISNSYSKLTKDYKKIFDGKVEEMSERIFNFEGVQNALYNTLGKDFPMLGKIIKEVEDMRKDWTIVDRRMEDLDIKWKPLEQFLEEELEYLTIDNTITGFMGDSKKTVSNMGDLKQNIIDYRDAQYKYATHQVDGNISGEHLAEVTINQLKYHKGHNATAARIGRGFNMETGKPHNDGKKFRVDKNGVQFKWNKKDQKWIKSTSRYQYYESIKDWVDNVLNKLAGVEITKENGALKQTKGGRWYVVPDKIQIHGTTGRLVKDDKTKKMKFQHWVTKKDLHKFHGTVALGRKVTLPYEVSETEAKKYQDEMMKYLDFVEKKDNPTQFAMTITALGSHPNGMGRMSARVKWRVKNIEFFKNDQLRYEHRPPWRYTAVNLANHFMVKRDDVKIKKLFDSYVVAIIPIKMDRVITERFKDFMQKDFKAGDNSVAMYYDSVFYGEENMYAIENIDPKSIDKDGKPETLGEMFVDPENADIKDYRKISMSYTVSAGRLGDFNAAMDNINKPRKGISIVDFDDTLVTSKSKIHYTIPRRLPNGGFNPAVVGWGAISDSGSLTPAEFAEHHGMLKGYGAIFDFAEFNKVKKGKKGPFFNKAKALKEKFGNNDIFILTARPPSAKYAIQAFLKGVGLDIKLENIVGLENGTSQAKVDWITERAAEGYNDFLFADDQIQNIKAVKKALDLLDVKGTLYQARSEISNSFTPQTLDTILDENNQDSPVVGQKKLTGEEAKFFGKPKPWYKRILNFRDKTNLIFVPPSAEDLKGLWNNHVAGKGIKGEADIAWFEEAIMRPYARGERASDVAKLVMLSELDKLYKAFGKDFRKELTKPYSDIHTLQDGIRMYVWNKLGYDIPGNQKSIKNTIDKIKKHHNAKLYADQLIDNVYNNKGLKGRVEYAEPGKNWAKGSIDNDVLNSLRNARKTFYKEFLNNKKNIFTKENLNKIEAIYGTEYRKAMEDMFFRMESGVNRNAKDLNNFWLRWLNAGVGNIMFINIRSALLQFTSFTNFIDVLGDNNPIAATARLKDIKTFKKDVAMLWSSPYLRARRLRGKIDIAMNEILEGIDSSEDFFWNISQKLIKKGYKPTQFMDSAAIAFGGAAFYRNRYNTYIKLGQQKGEAHNRAMRDWREKADETQQSARADLISQQQASVGGRIFLSFQNVTMQYTRMAKKMFIDIKNKRRVKKPDGTFESLNRSRSIQAGRIGMYMGYQHFIFQGLQQGILALMWNEDDENEVPVKRKVDYLNGVIDAIMRGMGILGGVLSVIKNIALETYRGNQYRAQQNILSVSPGLKSKYTKAQKIIRGLDKGEISDLLIEGPSFVYGLPTDRVVKLIDQIGYGFDLYGREYENYQRIMLLLGWNHYNFYDGKPPDGIINQIENWGGLQPGPYKPKPIDWGDPDIKRMMEEK
jgi:hypothetical protein